MRYKILMLSFPVLRLISRIRRNPSATLLLVQLLGLVLYPLMENVPAGRALFAGFGLVVLGMALRVVRSSPWATSTAVGIALCVITLFAFNPSGEQHALTAITSGLEAVFYFYAAGALIAYMLQDFVATSDELFAAGATFTLLAWGFAHVFALCQVLVPGSFVDTASAQPDAALTWIELLFLSFTTLSGVGLGDIIPLTPMGRGLVMLGEFTGVMYLALVVSRLVGLTIAQAKK